MRRRLGQHFLTDQRALARIADALELTGSETVVEIGPGRGALTTLLLSRAQRVIAIELDDELVSLLRERFPTLTIVHADVRDVSLAGAAGTNDYVLAGNIPYYITTPILFHALVPPMPRRSVFLVQREVAERVVAEPGSKTYGALSVNVQAVAVPSLVARVPPGAFNPPPDVDSAILAFTPRADPLVAAAEQKRFADVVIAAFGLRRKQMRRVVRTLGHLSQDAAEGVLSVAGIDPEVRPEDVSPEQFAALYRSLR